MVIYEIIGMNFRGTIFFKTFKSDDTRLYLLGSNSDLVSGYYTAMTDFASEIYCVPLFLRRKLSNKFFEELEKLKHSINYIDLDFLDNKKNEMITFFNELKLTEVTPFLQALKKPGAPDDSEVFSQLKDLLVNEVFSGLDNKKVFSFLKELRDTDVFSGLENKEILTYFNKFNLTSESNDEPSVSNSNKYVTIVISSEDHHLEEGVKKKIKYIFDTYLNNVIKNKRQEFWMGRTIDYDTNSILRCLQDDDFKDLIEKNREGLDNFIKKLFKYNGEQPNIDSKEEESEQPEIPKIIPLQCINSIVLTSSNNTILYFIGNPEIYKDNTKNKLIYNIKSYLTGMGMRRIPQDGTGYGGNLGENKDVHGFVTNTGLKYFERFELKKPKGGFDAAQGFIKGLEGGIYKLAEINESANDPNDIVVGLKRVMELKVKKKLNDPNHEVKEKKNDNLSPDFRKDLDNINKQLSDIGLKRGLELNEKNKDVYSISEFIKGLEDDIYTAEVIKPKDDSSPTIEVVMGLKNLYKLQIKKPDNVEINTILEYMRGLEHQENLSLSNSIGLENLDDFNNGGEIEVTVDGEDDPKFYIIVKPDQSNVVLDYIKGLENDLYTVTDIKQNSDFIDILDVSLGLVANKLEIYTPLGGYNALVGVIEGLTRGEYILSKINDEPRSDYLSLEVIIEPRELKLKKPEGGVEAVKNAMKYLELGVGTFDINESQDDNYFTMSIKKEPENEILLYIFGSELAGQYLYIANNLREIIEKKQDVAQNTIEDQNTVQENLKNAEKS